MIGNLPRTAHGLPYNILRYPGYDYCRPDPLCLIISPLAAKPSMPRSIYLVPVNAWSTDIHCSVIGIKNRRRFSHRNSCQSLYTQEQKLIRGRTLLILLWERTRIIIDCCLMLCQQRGIYPPESPAGPHWWHHIIILSVPSSTIFQACPWVLFATSPSHKYRGISRRSSECTHCSA